MHEDEYDPFHYHALDDPLRLQSSHPLWKADRIELKSVGIDIGSATSHLIFSTLVMRRQSAALSSRFELVERAIHYASPIILTPFVAGTSLDVQKLADFFDGAYAQAGWERSEIHTGAVITTGDAARKDNAEAVVHMFSGRAGRFVCASAGPMLEAKMAAYGSGAVAWSSQGEAPVTVLNIDVGGGTTKLALVHGGRVLNVTALNVGARLITFDEAGLLTRIERGAAIVAEHRRLSLAVGRPVTPETRRELAQSLAAAVLEVAGRRPLSELTRALMIGAPLTPEPPADVLMLSGGVSEYFYNDAVPEYGDIGPLIAQEIRQSLAKVLPKARLEKPVQGIRATVVGASQFTARVSGNTIHIGDPALLPLRNVCVVPITIPASALTADGVADAVRQALLLSEQPADRTVALAVEWPHGPAYAGLAALSHGVAAAMRSRVDLGQPVILVLDTDLARLTGSLISEALGGSRNVLCIDGIELQEFDYIDIGQQLAFSDVVTVIVKSLVFTG